MMTQSFLNGQTALVSLGASVPGVFARGVAAAANEGNARGKTLVVVQLAGGVDGLNTVVPYKDPAYRTNRPNLGVAENTLLPVNDRVAFHPSLSKLKGLFDAGKLAVVEGVGYPNPSFSHFRAMDIWQGADPEMKLHDGWLGRYFDGLTDLQGHPLAGVSIGGAKPQGLRRRQGGGAGDRERRELWPPARVGDQGPRSGAHQPAQALRHLQAGQHALRGPAGHDAGERPGGLGAAQDRQRQLPPAVQYPQNPLATGLRLLAELIDSGPCDKAARGPGDAHRLRHAHAADQAPRAAAHGAQRRPQRLLERPHRPRPRGRRAGHDLVGVRPSRQGERPERHRPRLRRADVRHGRRGQRAASTARRPA